MTGGLHVPAAGLHVSAGGLHVLAAGSAQYKEQHTVQGTAHLIFMNYTLYMLYIEVFKQDTFQWDKESL